MIDNYIADQSPRITMTLSEILANTPPVQTLAQATDVPGTNLEWMKTAAYLTGAWFGDLGELGTTGFRDSLFTGYLALGVTCKVSGVPYSWYGSAWEVGWKPSSCGPIYNGTTLPFPTGGDCLRIRAINPAVPKGWSWLEWNRTIWAPPDNELIAFASGSGSAIADVSPGALTTSLIYSGVVIPDYMMPTNALLDFNLAFGAVSTAPANECGLMAGVTGESPKPNMWDYPRNISITPNIASTNYFTGFGVNAAAPVKILVGADGFYHQDGALATSIDQNKCGARASGANRIVCVAKPSNAGDRFRVDYVKLTMCGVP